MAAGRSRADLREPRRLRHAVRPPQRRRRATRRNLERFDAPPGRAAAAAAAATICWSSPPITATIRRRRAPITRASTCRCSSTGAARARAASISARAPTFADLGQTLAEVFGVGPLAHGTSFLRRDRSRGAMTLREQLEAREREILAPQAAKSADSRGRLRPEPEDDVRPAFQRDRDRIIHCKAFRRLKHKTQVFFAPTGDHYRTRLTHTLEVSQIARTIAKVLRLHEELTEAIALGHDLGHTPFGHAGERVIDALMPGGFNHYEQSLRIVDRARERRPRAEPDVGSARRHREAFEGEVRRAGRHAGGACARARSKARSCASPTSSPTSTTTSTMRRARGCCGPRICRAIRCGSLGATVVGAHRHAGQGRRHRDAGRRPDGDPHERRRCSTPCSSCAASCSTRSTRTRSRPPSSRRRRAS